MVGDGWREGKGGMVVEERRCGDVPPEKNAVDEVDDEMLTPKKCH